MKRFGILFVTMISLLTSPLAAWAAASQALAPQATAVIQPGEGLSQFSLRVLGTSRRWQEIFKLNSDRVVSANLVLAGTVLRLPGQTQQAVAPPAEAAPSTWVASHIAPNKSEEPIRAGESLSEFSLRVLGTCKLWPKLYAWNRDRISTPDQVMAGTSLRLSDPGMVASAQPVVTAPFVSVPQPVRRLAEKTPEKAIVSSDVSVDDVTPQMAPTQLKPYGKMELPF